MAATDPKPMTFAEAYDKAKRRWGSHTHISVTFSSKGDGYMVGNKSGRVGRGRSWEDAFADADAPEEPKKP